MPRLGRCQGWSGLALYFLHTNWIMCQFLLPSFFRKWLLASQFSGSPQFFPLWHGRLLSPSLLQMHDVCGVFPYISHTVIGYIHQHFSGSGQGTNAISTREQTSTDEKNQPSPQEFRGESWLCSILPVDSWHSLAHAEKTGEYNVPTCLPEVVAGSTWVCI